MMKLLFALTVSISVVALGSEVVPKRTDVAEASFDRNGVSCGVAAAYILLQIHGKDTISLSEIQQSFPQLDLTLRDVASVLTSQKLKNHWIKSTHLPDIHYGAWIGLLRDERLRNGHYVVVVPGGESDRDWIVFDSLFDRPIHLTKADVEKLSWTGYWLVRSDNALTSNILGIVLDKNILQIGTLLLITVCLIFVWRRKGVAISNRQIASAWFLGSMTLLGCSSSDGSSSNGLRHGEAREPIDLALSQSSETAQSKSMSETVPLLTVNGDHKVEQTFSVNITNDGASAIEMDKCMKEGSCCKMVSFSHLEPSKIPPGETGKAHFRVKAAQASGYVNARWELLHREPDGQSDRIFDGDMRIYYKPLSNKIEVLPTNDLGVISENTKTTVIDASLTVTGRTGSLQPDQLKISTPLAGAVITRFEEKSEIASWAFGEKYYLPFRVEIPVASLRTGPFEHAIRFEFGDTSREMRLIGTVSAPWVVNGKTTISALVLSGLWLPNDFIVRNLDDVPFTVVDGEIDDVPYIKITPMQSNQFTMSLLKALSEDEKMRLTNGTRIRIKVRNDQEDLLQFEMPIRITFR